MVSLWKVWSCDEDKYLGNKWVKERDDDVEKAVRWQRRGVQHRQSDGGGAKRLSALFARPTRLGVVVSAGTKVEVIVRLSAVFPTEKRRWRWNPGGHYVFGNLVLRQEALAEKKLFLSGIARSRARRGLRRLESGEGWLWVVRGRRHRNRGLIRGECVRQRGDKGILFAVEEFRRSVNYSTGVQEVPVVAVER